MVLIFLFAWFISVLFIAWAKSTDCKTSHSSKSIKEREEEFQRELDLYRIKHEKAMAERKRLKKMVEESLKELGLVFLCPIIKCYLWF